METATAGTVKVTNEVIASIAAMAALEIDGVVVMDEMAARHFGDWFKRQAAHRGVRIVIDGERSIPLEVFLTVDSGAAVGEVASAVQANVLEAVERMLGLEVAEVNDFVSSVSFS